MVKGWNRRYLLLGVVAAVLLATAGVAYALTSASFEPRAAAWDSSTCNEALLNGKVSAANNQKIATCFAVEKVKEQQSTISGLQASVTKLETTQTPPPLDFAFFNGLQLVKSPVVSPVLDAGKYKTITVSAQGAGSIILETSFDQTTWIAAANFGTGTQSTAVSVSGRYYRVVASPGLGASSVYAFAHLTA
jgi:hypothetical protein